MARARLLIGSFGVTFCLLAGAQEPHRDGLIPLSSIVERLENTQAGRHRALPYQVIREYRLVSPNHANTDAEVVAEVNFTPPDSQEYRIQKSGGSHRGQQIIRRVLQHEVEALSSANPGRSALTRDNYDFTYLGEAPLGGQPCYLLALKPKRKEVVLISGRVWVDEHAFVVRQVEGELARTPSWLLKKVQVKIAFGDLGGLWLQTAMEAVADVRVAGLHILTSRTLDYRDPAEVASIAP